MEGFRPCKRCNPDSKTNQDDPQKISVAKACNFIKQEAEGGGKLECKGAGYGGWVDRESLLQGV